MLDVDQHFQRLETGLCILKRSEENFGWDVRKVEFKALSADVDKSRECPVESEKFIEFLWGEVENDSDSVPRQITQ